MKGKKQLMLNVQLLFGYLKEFLYVEVCVLPLVAEE